MARIVLLPGLSLGVCTPITGDYLPAAHPIWALSRQQISKIRLEVWEHGHNNEQSGAICLKLNKKAPRGIAETLPEKVPNPCYFLQSWASGVSQHMEKAKIFFLPRQIPGQQLLPSERRQEVGRWCRMSYSGHGASREEPSIP